MMYCLDFEIVIVTVVVGVALAIIVARYIVGRG
jgi:hypothetical protein